ncbi:hypothetical protein [Microbacterium paulum]
MMLAAGADVVLRDGLSLSVSDLTLEDLIRVAGAPRSAVFRIWPHHSAYLVDLLEHLLDGAGRRSTPGIR